MKTIDQAIQDAKAFFAFSDEQFNEAKEPNVKYTHLGAGLYCPTTKTKDLINEINNITKNQANKDLEENGKDQIIKRELFNHEAFITGDIFDTFEALKHYPTITKDDVQRVYNELYPVIYK